MRMDVRAGSLWVAYTVTRPDALRAMLPPGLRLSGAALVAPDRRAWVAPPVPKLLFNAYDVEAPWMRGHRVDVCTLAEDPRTGVTYFVLLDCVSDTLRWTPDEGVRGPNARVSPRSVSSRSRGDRRGEGCGGGRGGLPYALTVRTRAGETLSVRGARGESVPIEWTFAVEANRRCFYRSDPTAFVMAFDEEDVMRPVTRLVGADVHNDLWRKVRAARPSHVFVHEHPMSFSVGYDGGRGIRFG